MTYICIICGYELLVSTIICPPIIRGTLDGNYAYTSGVNGKSTSMYYTYGGGALAILRRDLRGDKKLTVLDAMNNRIGGGSSSLLRWQLIDKRYYFVTHRLGSVESVYRFSAALDAFALPLLESVYADGIDEAERQKRIQEHLNPPSGNYYYPFFGSVMYGFETDANKRRIFFDIWSRGGKNWELYITEPHMGNRLAREDFNPGGGNRGAGQEKMIWGIVGAWTFDWTGPFYVAANGDDRYFVTDTGRVFATPPAAKPAVPVKEIWKNDVVTGSSSDRVIQKFPPLKVIWKGPPVEALIHDADAKKCYAFTKDQYFEVADPIKPRPHTIPIRRAWDAKQALETAVKCGRVIRGLPDPAGK